MGTIKNRSQIVGFIKRHVPLNLSFPSVSAFFFEFHIAKQFTSNSCTVSPPLERFYTEGVKAERMKRSKAWHHFPMKNDTSAHCNVCQMRMETSATHWSIFDTILQCNMGLNWHLKHGCYCFQSSGMLITKDNFKCSNNWGVTWAGFADFLFDEEKLKPKWNQILFKYFSECGYRQVPGYSQLN